MPPKGRPPKKKRNISGLKNQPSRSNAPLESITESNPPDLDDDSHENGHEPIPPDAKDRASSEHCLKLLIVLGVVQIPLL